MVKAIEQVEIGDLVWAWDSHTDTLVKRPVVRLFRHAAKPVLDVVISNGVGESRTITATVEHPFWVETKGWVAAQDLAPGDLLKQRTAGGGPLRVASVSGPHARADVFNFEVGDAHNYFVGSSGVLVHNKSEMEPTAAQKRAYYWDQIGDVLSAPFVHEGKLPSGLPIVRKAFGRGMLNLDGSREAIANVAQRVHQQILGVVGKESTLHTYPVDSVAPRAPDAPSPWAVQRVAEVSKPVVDRAQLPWYGRVIARLLLPSGVSLAEYAHRRHWGGFLIGQVREYFRIEEGRKYTRPATYAEGGFLTDLKRISRETDPTWSDIDKLSPHAEPTAKMLNELPSDGVWGRYGLREARRYVKLMEASPEPLAKQAAIEARKALAWTTSKDVVSPTQHSALKNLLDADRAGTWKPAKFLPSLTRRSGYMGIHQWAGVAESRWDQVSEAGFNAGLEHAGGVAQTAAELLGLPNFRTFIELSERRNPGFFVARTEAVEGALSELRAAERNPAATAESIKTARDRFEAANKKAVAENPNVDRRPNVIRLENPPDPSHPYVLDVDAQMKVLAQTERRLGLSLPIPVVKGGFGLAYRQMLYLSSPGAEAGYVAIPKGTPLSAAQVSTFEQLYKGGRTTYTEEHKSAVSTTELYRTSIPTPFWQGMKSGDGFIYSGPMGSLLPRIADPRMTLMRRDIGFYGSVKLKIPYAPVPAVPIFSPQLGLVFKYVGPHSNVSPSFLKKPSFWTPVLIGAMAIYGAGRYLAPKVADALHPNVTPSGAQQGPH